MSAASIVDQLCRYFGGPYDPGTHTYRDPQLAVPGMSGPIVRRGAPKHDDHATDYHLVNPPAAGVPIGCLMVIFAEFGDERRVAVAGAVSGVKHVSHKIRVHCFIRCLSQYSEDAQDAQYALLEAILGRIRADRTCGSGGFEAGYGVGFQVGEGGEPWIRWQSSPISKGGRDLSKGYLLVEFDADEYIQA